MRKRELILDFTSLLDVTLIVIFFFVIFSHLEDVENTEMMDAKMAEMEEAIAMAEASEAAANEAAQLLQEEIEIVRASNERQASNVSEILTYARSGNIKLILTMEEEAWTLRVNYQNEMISEITSDMDTQVELLEAIEETGYMPADTIFCDFVFDGSLPGTASVYRRITEAIESVKEEYSYFYFSETDLSVGGE